MGGPDAVRCGIWLCGLTEAALQRYAEIIRGPIEEMLGSPASFAEKLDAVLRFAGEEPRLRYAQFFAGAAATGEWQGGISPELAARYQNEQSGLALSQRASGASAESVRELLALAISVPRRSRSQSPVTLV